MNKASTASLLLSLALLFSIAIPATRAQGSPKETGASTLGPFKVASLERTFKDEAREGREVPLKIYYPEEGQGPFPVIIFSHGLGGSMEGYQYLGSCWASNGFVCAHVQHKGSDEDLWKGKAMGAGLAMTKAMFSMDNLVNRPKDISFAIDKMGELNASEPFLKGRLDIKRLGVAGHSFGAYTTLAIAGQTFSGEKSFGDERVIAAIEMSAPGRTLRRNGAEEAYSSIKIPMMHMTGTNDKMPFNENPENRLLPFKNINATNQFLLVFDGGDHMLFSGQRRKGDGANDALYHSLILRASVAFWSAFLKGDKDAMNYLKSDSGLKKDLAASAAYEVK